MPIRPENRRHYPANWRTAIRPRILARAGHRCEGSLASPDCRAANHQPHPVTGSRVIFTVAHLDQTPEHWHPAHLRAWCQRCHHIYDAPHRQATRRHQGQRCHTGCEFADVVLMAQQRQQERRHAALVLAL